MIVLFTDFGLAGPYTGQVTAVLRQGAPEVPIVPLFADAPSERPKPAAYLLAAYGAWFPAGTVLLCVVDPGVGSERRAVVAEADGRIYVGPDNGLFDIVMRRAQGARLWEIIWHPGPLSPSFHGRDLFAPVAARLALGDPVTEVAQPADDKQAARGWPDDLAEIVYIDHYGNAMTGLRGALLAPEARLVVADRALERAATFSAVPPGEAFWYINSNGLAEVAVNGARADATLGLEIGSRIRIEN
ncbi:MAG TPA: SAM-dependent chlorinase/fluorinase [Stellaceae bacterium]|jgi:S-adenosylmethionine hydrolase|nr:SAM-dependent chlorinase/fluorinase [Stellaceae bacterium]